VDIFIGIALIVLAAKVGPALARRIDSRSATDPGAARQLQEMQERLEQVEERVLTLASDSHERLVDIEERVDFAERVLQQQRAAQIPPQGN